LNLCQPTVYFSLLFSHYASRCQNLASDAIRFNAHPPIAIRAFKPFVSLDLGQELAMGWPYFAR
jgi:hypothetical protein